ncbi:unnamed protein product [Lampetra planeri]
MAARGFTTPPPQAARSDTKRLGVALSASRGLRVVVFGRRTPRTQAAVGRAGGKRQRPTFGVRRRRAMMKADGQTRSDSAADANGTSGGDDGPVDGHPNGLAADPASPAGTGAVPGGDDGPAEERTLTDHLNKRLLESFLGRLNRGEARTSAARDGEEDGDAQASGPSHEWDDCRP